MSHGVCYIVGSFKSGGTETQLVELLRRLDRTRITPYVICLERRGGLLPEVEATGAEIRETGFDRLLSRRARASLRDLAGWIGQREIRIVHGFPFHGVLYGAMLKRLRPEVKLVTSEQAVYAPGGLRHRLGRHWYYGKVDQLTANCEAVKRALASRDRLDPDRIRVIYGGVDTDRFRPRRRKGTGGAIVGCVGRLHQDKGQDLLLRAAPAVIREAPDTRFRLVGDGPRREAIESLAASLGIEGSVDLLGDRQDVPDLLPGFDILVLPSASEGFSNAALEGSACGVPVVASRVGGNPEIVVEGETGHLFPRGDHQALAGRLLDLIRDPERARRMGEAGRRRVETIFPLSEMVRRHERLYEEILEGEA